MNIREQVDFQPDVFLLFQLFNDKLAAPEDSEKITQKHAEALDAGKVSAVSSRAQQD